jgi:hypothetical protein
VSDDELKGIVRDWQRRLCLGGWELTVDLERPAKGDSFAWVNWSHDYDTATIKFCRRWRDWDRRMAERVVAHELVHLLLRDVEFVVSKMARPRLNDAEGSLFDVAFEHELERAVDRLSARMVDLAARHT